MTVITKQRTAPWPRALGTSWMNVGKGSRDGCGPGQQLWNGGHTAPGEGHVEPGMANVFLEGVQRCVQAGDDLVTDAEELGKPQESSAAILSPQLCGEGGLPGQVRPAGNVELVQVWYNPKGKGRGGMAPGEQPFNS